MKENVFYKIIIVPFAHIIEISVGIYAIYTIFNAKKLKLTLTKEWYVLLGFFMARPIFDVWAYTIYNNLIPTLTLAIQAYSKIGSHIYVPLQFVVYVYTFTKWQMQTPMTKIIQFGIVGIFLALFVGLKVSGLEPLNEFPSISLIVSNCMIMFLSMPSQGYNVQKSFIPPHENPHYIVAVAVTVSSLAYIVVSVFYPRFPVLQIAFPAINIFVNTCFFYALYQLNRYMKRFNKSIGESWHD